MKKKIVQEMDEEKQVLARQAIMLICELMDFNEKVMPETWATSFLAILANMSYEAGISHEDFASTLVEAGEAYKPLWDKNIK